jgi:hypothetical protein
MQIEKFFAELSFTAIQTLNCGCELNSLRRNSFMLTDV